MYREILSLALVCLPAPQTRSQTLPDLLWGVGLPHHPSICRPLASESPSYPILSYPTPSHLLPCEMVNGLMISF